MSDDAPLDEPRLVDHHVVGNWTFDALAAELGDVEVPVQLVDATGVVRREERRPFHQWAAGAEAGLMPSVRGLHLALCPSLALAIADSVQERCRFVRAVFCGLKGSTTVLHADERDNRLTVLHGAKEVTIISPENSRAFTVERLLELSAAMDVAAAAREGSSARVPELFAEGAPEEVLGVPVQRFVVKHGRSLLLPRLWLHHVRNLSDCVAVSAWNRSAVIKPPSLARCPSSRSSRCRRPQQLPKSLWGQVLQVAFTKDPCGISRVATACRDLRAVATQEELWNDVILDYWLLDTEHDCLVIAACQSLAAAGDAPSYRFCQRADAVVRDLIRCHDVPRSSQGAVVSAALRGLPPELCGALLFTHCSTRGSQQEKTAAGELLGLRVSSQVSDLQRGFISQISVSDCNLVGALVQLLTALALPGEAQLIERIIEQFAEHFTSARGGLHAEEQSMSADAAFCLAFSFIMLHTDFHNPGVRNKMNEDQFVSPQRGMNNGASFDDDLIRGYYQEVTGGAFSATGLSPRMPPQQPPGPSDRGSCIAM